MTNPQIWFPLGGSQLKGLRTWQFAAYFPPENTGDLMNEAVWPRLEYERVCMCLLDCMCSLSVQIQKEGLDSLKLEFQAITNWPV